MKRVVISQPMFFPWVGMLEQIKLADVYVYYDDVQFSKGSFTNRVQIKTPEGSKWLTVPVNVKLGQPINQATTDEHRGWRESHLSLLEQSYRNAPFAHDMLALVRDVYSRPLRTIADLSIASTNALCVYFGLDAERIASSRLAIGGRSSQRVLDIVRNVEGDVYITGHGARDYLDHDSFEEHRVRVEYMDYQMRPYPQLYGTFTPYVSALDLVANVGREGSSALVSASIYWKDFLSK